MTAGNWLRKVSYDSDTHGYPPRQEALIEKGSEETEILSSLPFLAAVLYTFTALYFPSSTFRSTRSTSGSPELLKVMGPAALSKFLI